MADAPHPTKQGTQISFDTFNVDGFADQRVETTITSEGETFDAVGKIHRIGVNHFGISWDRVTPT